MWKPFLQNKRQFIHTPLIKKENIDQAVDSFPFFFVQCLAPATTWLIFDLFGHRVVRQSNRIRCMNVYYPLCSCAAFCDVSLNIMVLHLLI